MFPQSILPLREPPVSKSALLEVVLEPDEDAPDDPEAFTIAKAGLAPLQPDAMDGYTHPTGDYALGRSCTERRAGRLCDVGWLEEFVNCVGARALVESLEVLQEAAAKRASLRLLGRMVSECFHGSEGADYDEYFEVEKVELC